MLGDEVNSTAGGNCLNLEQNSRSISKVSSAGGTGSDSFCAGQVLKTELPEATYEKPGKFFLFRP